MHDEIGRAGLRLEEPDNKRHDPLPEAALLLAEAGVVFALRPACGDVHGVGAQAQRRGAVPLVDVAVGAGRVASEVVVRHRSNEILNEVPASL
eukprot:75614-Alexandrium_andersonii.AAC.1